MDHYASRRLPRRSSPVLNDPEQPLLADGLTACRRRRGCRGHGRALRVHLRAERARQAPRAARSRSTSPTCRPGASKTVEWRRQAGMGGASHARDDSRHCRATTPNWPIPCRLKDQPARGLCQATRRARIEPDVFVAVGICTHLGLLANRGAAGQRPTRACRPTGRAASSVPATARPSTAPGACSRTSPHRPTWRFLRIAMPATRASSSARRPSLKEPHDMWYFAWMLGVGFAVLLAIMNAMWGENEDARARRGRREPAVSHGGRPWPRGARRRPAPRSTAQPRVALTSWSAARYTRR